MPASAAAVRADRIAPAHPGATARPRSRRASHLDPKLVRYARTRAAALRREAFGRALLVWVDSTERTQIGLAAETGVTLSSVNHWINGTTSPTRRNLIALTALGFRATDDST